MKTFWVSVLCLIIVIGGFFVTSLCLANNNNRTLKEEWNSWFTIEEKVDTETEEETEEDIDGEVVVEETAMVVVE